MQIVRTTIQGIYLVVSLVYLTSLVSCTIEEKTKRFTVITKNESGHPLNIQAFSKDELIEESDLLDGESGLECNYYSYSFLGYECEFDSIIYKFPNGHGYIEFSGDYTFDEKRSPTNQGIFNHVNDQYEFVITSEDYENAHELPE